MAGTNKPRTDPFTTLRRTALGRDQARINQMLRDLVHAKRFMPSVVEQLELRTSPLRASVTDGAGGHGGISDPTPLGGEYARWSGVSDELAARLVETAGHLVIIRRLVDLVMAETIDTDAEAARQRCTGGEPGTEGWERPECERNAVTKDGLCLACYQRRHHHRSKPGAA